MAREVCHYRSKAGAQRAPWLVLVSIGLLTIVRPLAEAAFDIYHFDDMPKAYEAYDRQCGYQSQCCNYNSCPNLEDFCALEMDALEKAVAEMRNNEAMSMNPAFLIQDREFDMGFFQTKAMKCFEDLGVRRTLTTSKVLQAMFQKYGFCQLRNLLEGRCYSNLTLSCCKGTEQITCDPYYPYRSYDGSCNNLRHPSWGKRGNALKHPIAPCYSDLVSAPAVSRSGRMLPQNRKLISDIAAFLDQKAKPGLTSNINMMCVFFSELMNSDMIGRANKRTCRATGGFRGCRADGTDRSPQVSPLSNPLRVLPDDRYYGKLGTRCLNFSPQEKANDRCELKHVAERNLESSYLDLSSLYTEERPHYDAHGKLKLFQCGVTESLALSEPLTVQFFAVAGLFGKLHNYCADRVQGCPGGAAGSVHERCRAFTIGVYQKIVYEQLLPFLFGDELFNLCGLNCQYNPYVESSVSQVYKSGPGRFQHVWIPEQMMYKQQCSSQWLPFNVFFHDHAKFDCSATLAGVLESPIQIGRLTHANVDKFYSEDCENGTCLPCIDLARNRDAGLCPLVTYKHFVEQRIGDQSEGSKCYSTFEEMSDMFSPEFCEFLKQNYESPRDVDVYLSILEKRRYPGCKLPKLVSQATCIEFKRLKCTDRFFYSWNPNLGEGARHLIKALDLTALLALFTDVPDVPLQPFVVDGPRVATSDVRGYVKTLDYLFCHV